MNTTQAADILGIEQGSVVDESTVKAAFRKAAQKYHPDKGGSTEMMQAVNAAYAELQKHYGETIAEFGVDVGYADRLNDAINAISHLDGLNIEVCGLWVWVSGDTRTHKDAIKAAGYFWASKKFMWYFRPEEAKGGRGRSMDEIRGKYGSVTVPTRRAAALTE